jgi:hypothetical protein
LPEILIKGMIIPAIGQRRKMLHQEMLVQNPLQDGTGKAFGIEILSVDILDHPAQPPYESFVDLKITFFVFTVDFLGEK